MKANAKIKTACCCFLLLTGVTALRAQCSAYPGAGFRLPKSNPGTAVFKPLYPINTLLDRAPAPPRRSLLLPQWSAEELPVFCKIEHQWAKKLPMPVKFRLGSVEYVDWLEGKIVNY
jgi:hypothetical protein